jgi:hypothetical protein
MVVDEPDEDVDERESWLTLRKAMVDFLLIRKRLFPSQAFLQNMSVRGGPNVAKSCYLESLLARNFVLKCACSAAGGKASEVFVPCLTLKTSLDTVIQHRVRECDLQLPESYDVEAFATYLHSHLHRRENVQIFAAFWKHMSTAKHKKAGKPTAQEKQRKADMLGKAQHLLDAEKHGDDLLEKFHATTKRRRTAHRIEEVKTEDGEKSKAKGALASVTCSYHYSGPTTLRTRKQASEFSAQRMSRRVQAVILPHTHDLDIENSLFTLIAQLLEKLDVDPAMPAEAREALDLCAQNRARVCAEILSLPGSRGKQLLVSTFYGGSVSPELQKLDFAHNLQKVSVYCKWVAISCLSDEYRAFLQDSKKTNPEGSLLSYLYTACEDFILSHWVQFLMETFHPQHLSLHYDGVRISTVDAVSIADVCTQSEAYIKRMTGFEVRIREKTHKLVLQAMKEAAVAGPAVYAADDVLCKAGNCIPHALACLEMLEPGHMYVLNNGTDQNNVYMQQRGSRTSRQCMNMFGCSFSVALLTDGEVPEGKFLLHCENGGRPHCVGVHVTQESEEVGQQVTMWDVDGVYRLSVASFTDALLRGTDASTSVSFLVAGRQIGGLG